MSDGESVCACCNDGEQPLWARGTFWHTTDSPYAPYGLADECQNWLARAAAADTLADALLERAAKEPLGVDISDYSDEWCHGFLAGQENALERFLAAYDAARSNT